MREMPKTLEISASGLIVEADKDANILTARNNQLGTKLRRFSASFTH